MRPDDFNTGTVNAHGSCANGQATGRAAEEVADLTPELYAAMNNLVTVIQEAQIVLGLEVEDLVILLTVLTGNLQRWHRGLGMELADGQIEVELVPMSQSGVARATGIARETVRRRLRDLAARGVLTLDDRGAATANRDFADRLMALRPFRRWRGLQADPAARQASV